MTNPIPDATPPSASPEPRSDAKPSPVSTVHIVVASVAAVLGISLLVLMLAAAPMLVRWGLVGHLWYVLLLALGLCTAFLSFALFKSWASYSGKVLSGKLELGGPAVIMLVVVILGFWLAPAPVMPFDTTVFLKAEDNAIDFGQLAHQGQLTIEVGTDRRTESIGDKGEARFIGLPSNLRQQSVAVALNSQKYELVDPQARITLEDKVATVLVRVKSLKFAGTVLGAKGQPLAQARVNVAGKAATTDGDGRFEMRVPADLPESDKFVAISAPGYRPFKAAVSPGGNALEVRLER